MGTCGHLLTSLSLFEFLKQTNVRISGMLRQIWYVDSFGHCGCKAFYTFAFWCACGVTFSIGYVTDIIPHFNACACFVSMPRMVGRTSGAFAAVDLTMHLTFSMKVSKCLACPQCQWEWDHSSEQQTQSDTHTPITYIEWTHSTEQHTHTALLLLVEPKQLLWKPLPFMESKVVLYLFDRLGIIVLFQYKDNMQHSTWLLVLLLRLDGIDFKSGFILLWLNSWIDWGNHLLQSSENNRFSIL